MNFYKSFQYLENHVIFNNEFLRCLDIEVVKVNPKNLKISKNKDKNTKTQVWLECGPYMKDVITHDFNLDCGAKTFEKAIIKLAKLVRKEYSDDDEIALDRVNRKYNNKKE